MSAKNSSKAEPSQYFRLCIANSLNPDVRVWSYRKVVKTAAKHSGGISKKIERKTTSRRIIKQLKPSKKRMEKQLKHAAKHAAKQANKNNNDNQNNSYQNRINQDLYRARKEVADADRYLPRNKQYRVQARGLEDDDDLD
jgi:hypothetical protein